MATTRKRSSAAAAVAKTAIAQSSAMLKQLPEKPKSNWSLREAVSALQGSIEAALERGYTYEEVAVLLGERGVAIAPPSLKRYLAAVKRDKGTGTRRGGRKSKAALESSTLASVASSLTDAAEPAPAKRRGGRPPKAASEPKAAAKKAKATPTTTTKTAAKPGPKPGSKSVAAKTTAATTTKTTAAKATRGRKKTAS